MTVDWITTYQKYFKPGALITDVSSVKTGVVEPIQKIIRRDVAISISRRIRKRFLSWQMSPGIT